jgi:hypothetical protein
MIAGVTRAIGRQAVKHLGKAKAAVAKGAAQNALQAGVSFAAPDVAEAIVGSAEGREGQPTSTPQQTVQAIADPRNEVATQRTLMLQRMGMLGSLSPVVPRRDISQYVMGIDDF